MTQHGLNRLHICAACNGDSRGSMPQIMRPCIRAAYGGSYLFEETIEGEYLEITFGPFKLVGGLAKGHPTDEEIRNAVNFYEGLKS